MEILDDFFCNRSWKPQTPILELLNAAWLTRWGFGGKYQQVAHVLQGNSKRNNENQ